MSVNINPVEFHVTRSDIMINRRERKIKIVIQDNKYIVNVYCADGSFCYYGPFDTEQEAKICVYEIEHPSIYNEEYDY
jgi:hypothetical protein